LQQVLGGKLWSLLPSNTEIYVRLYVKMYGIIDSLLRVSSMIRIVNPYRTNVENRVSS